MSMLISVQNDDDDDSIDCREGLPYRISSG